MADDLEGELGEQSSMSVKQFSNGRYEGERNEQGDRHGKGWAVFPNGDVYEGEYENGKRNGHGTYYFALGKYIGEYQGGRRTGFGSMFYPDGSRYVGHFQDGVRHGQGTYYYVNGDTYVGGWIDGKQDGTGTYKSPKDGGKFTGTWKSGKRHGPADWITPSYRYIGDFEDGVPMGAGKFVFPKGYEQQGIFALKSTYREEIFKNKVFGTALVWEPKKLVDRKRSKVKDIFSGSFDPTD